MSSEAEEYLNTITAEGKEMSINIKIHDRVKAQQLMATMYDKNLDVFGVSVQSWGFWDIQKANKLRIEAINSEVGRHHQAIQYLIYKTDLDYLKENEKS